MPQVQSVRAECYATFTSDDITYRVATRGGVRGGNAFDGVLTAPIEPSEEFIESGILQGRRHSLVIADGPGGTFHTLAQGSVLTGLVVDVEAVTTITYTDNSTAEHAIAQRLTLTEVELRKTTVVLTVTDLEDERLNKPYPSALYSADSYPVMDPDGVGKAIPFPVGTALKVPCPLLAAQRAWDGTLVIDEWLYGVCELEWQSYPIVAVSTGAKTFTVTGDCTAQISAGEAMWVFEAGNRANTTNVGRYTTVSAVYSAPNTTITVVEALGSSSTGSYVNIPPRVLAVYRDGRLVASSEYTLEVIDNGAGPFPATTGDFSNPGDWIASSAGTGSAAVSGGQGTISGDGGATNWGTVRLSASIGAGLQARRHQYVPMRVTITGTGQCWMHGWTSGPPIAGMGSIARPSASRLLIKCPAGTGDIRLALSTFNAGASGTSLTLDNVSFDQPAKPLLLLRFNLEQVDFNGRRYEIEADVLGFRSRNAADEIKRVIEQAGGTADAATFATAQSYATTHLMLVDCDHGARGQRNYRAILDDLLFIARGTLGRNGAGAYTITQDKTGASAYSWNEGAGDLVDVEHWRRPGRPSSVALRYRPSSRDPADTLHEVTRSVTGGTLPERSARECHYLRDHTAADRLLCYVAKRAEFNGRLSARALLARPALGTVVTVTSAAVYTNAKDWYLWGLQHDLLGITFGAVEYDAAVHTYVPGTLPSDADTGYTPDYSQTPPAAPTALKITAGTTDVANDGTITARITVECVPPSVNWEAVWFKCIHNTTSEIGAWLRGDYSASTGKVSAVIGGLRPGEVYQLQAQAVNAFGIYGLSPATFDATGIGGGASVSTFTAPGHATVPSNVASCTATQGMGRIINVSWPAVTTANVWGYVLERQVGGGGYSEVWRGQANSYRDSTVAIGSAYQYRVKARDTYGNVSASYATSSSVTPTGNITGGTSGNDITNDTVASGNRTGVTQITQGWANLGGAGTTLVVNHSLGKVPIIASMGSGRTDTAIWVGGRTTTQITFQLLTAPNLATTSVAPNNPHSHNIVIANISGTLSCDVW